MMVGSAGMRGAFASQYTAGDRPFGAQLVEPFEPIDPPEFAPKKSLPGLEKITKMAILQQRRARLSIDVPREARRRIHIAAARRDQSIRQYVWEAVEARLKQDLADEFSAGDLVALNERRNPVLADLWENPKDAAYDAL
jgi:uncharacterized protein (DUF1778 family)